MPIGKFAQGFRGLIQAAAEARYGSAATNELISMAAKDAGQRMSFNDFTDVARLYGRFVGIRTGREVFQDALSTANRTGIDQGITAGMLPDATYARDLAQRLPFPQVRVHYQATVGATAEGPVRRVHRSFDLGMPEVHTVGSLKDLTDTVAGNQGGGYGEQFVDVDPTSIHLEQF